MVKAIAKKFLPQPLWTWMRLARIRHELHTYAVHVVHHNYGGWPLDLWIADTLGQGWYDHDWEELNEIALLKRHKLRPGAKIFDLGAHQCAVALMLARSVGPQGAVIAVEGNEHNVKVGLRNRELNRAENLRIIHAAVAERSGSIIFNQGLNGRVDDGRGEWGKVSVAAFSIDDLARQYGQPDVLFIDIEGFEFAALRGATETLSSRPDCFVEVHAGCGLEQLGGSVEMVLSSFLPEDYLLYTVTPPDTEFSPLNARDGLPSQRFFLVAIGCASR